MVATVPLGMEVNLTIICVAHAIMSDCNQELGISKVRLDQKCLQSPKVFCHHGVINSSNYVCAYVHYIFSEYGVVDSGFKLIQRILLPTLNTL